MMARLARYAAWVGSCLLVCWAASGFVQDAEELPPVLRGPQAFVKAHRPSLMVLTALGVLAAQVFGDLGEAHAVRRRVFQAVLDTLHQEYFAAVDAKKKYLHRVTLLRCRRLKRRLFLGGKSLAIHARSGRHSRSWTTMQVDDDREERCEGVSGRIWFINAPLTRTIRAWPEDEADAAAIEAYAKGGRITPAKARALNVKSRCFSGVTVRSAGGRRWGVLVVDSVTEGYIEESKEEILTHYAELLRRLL